MMFVKVFILHGNDGVKKIWGDLLQVHAEAAALGQSTDALSVDVVEDGRFGRAKTGQADGEAAGKDGEDQYHYYNVAHVGAGSVRPGLHLQITSWGNLCQFGAGLCNGAVPGTKLLSYFIRAWRR